MKFSMTGQEKCDLLIQVTAQAGLTVGYKLTRVITAMNIAIFTVKGQETNKLNNSLKNKLGLK